MNAREVEEEFARIRRVGFVQLRNFFLLSAVVLVGYGMADWPILLLLGAIGLAIAVSGMLTIFGVWGSARFPILAAVFLGSAAFIQLEDGVWRWIFFAMPGVFGLAAFREGPIY